ncbi:MAG: toll/interleukin-1 receptor domain-containing protein [Bdellovibrionales bacterium]|nr:toll/interleukin-1 receptor domain-containing protein [Bdellovibrionales bacterium]
MTSIFKNRKQSPKPEPVDLFLCHSSTDKTWVRELAKKIEAEPFEGRKLRVFLDEWDIDAGDNLVWRLNDGLSKARFLAVVMSPEMITSDWCKLEVSSALVRDPINRSGRLIPILLRDKHKKRQARLEVPPVLSALNYLDFRNAKDFQTQYGRLIAKVKGERGRRGANARSSAAEPLVALPDLRQSPDEISEVLVSNLLPVTPPKFVWSAQTFLSSKHDVHEFYTYPAFIVKGGRLYTFMDLNQPKNPFADLTKPNTRKTREEFSEWRESPDKWRWGIELLNDTLRRYLFDKGIKFNPKSSRYYFAPKGKRSVKVKWGAGDDRCVVRYPDGGVGNWVHQAARLRFETLGEDLYLSVEPSWMFTVDGHTSVPRERAGPLAIMWGGRERNGSILRHILMWSDAITQGYSTGQIQAGSQHLIIGRLPKTSNTSVGVATDHVAVSALLRFTEDEKTLTTPISTYGFLDNEGDDEEAPEAEA